MPTNDLVQARIDSAVTRKATAVLESMGLTISDAVRIMLTRTADEGALPFDPVGGDPAHDMWFRQKMKEALDGLEAGTNRIIPEAEWRNIADRKRAELMRLIDEPGR